MAVRLTDKILPLNDAFTGMVDDDQVLDSAVTSANILTSDGTVFQSVTMSGDATIATDGTVTVANDSHTHSAYVLHSLADAANDFLVASGADTFIKKTLAETGAILEGDIQHDNLQGLGTGAAHSYIDQDVTSGSTPTFTGTNFTGIPYSGLANGTDGELITWSATGTIATVAVGTATHVLTSNGVGAAPTFQAPAGGGTPGGSDTQIQWNDGGSSFGGLSTLTWDDTDFMLGSGGTTKLQFRDSAIYINSNADGEMTITADSMINLGTAGDVKIGDSTERDFYPSTSLKVNLGTTSNKFKDVVCSNLIHADYCSVTTTANSTASATTRDVFDEDNYTSYTSDANVTARGITYASGTGRFTVDNAGIYLITCLYNLNIGSSDEMNLIVKKNGTSVYTHDVFIHSYTDPSGTTVSLVLQLAASDYINFEAGSVDGVDVTTFYGGCTATIHKIAGV